MKIHPLSLIGLALLAPALFAEDTIPQWCRELPRAQYKTLTRVPVKSSWFEVYQPAEGVFAIYEPHQSEETISYLILGQRSALLFDTGMGIADLKGVTSELTRLPIVVSIRTPMPIMSAPIGSSIRFTAWIPISRA